MLVQAALFEQSLYSALEHSSKSSMVTRETITSDPSGRFVSFSVGSINDRIRSSSSRPPTFSSATWTRSLIFMSSLLSLSMLSVVPRSKFLFELLFTLMDVISEWWYKS